ncbi:flagellar assembly protein FliW [Desulfosporosinus sp. Sb-LF]|uniref:flagellar assembly protein FliW n=1 Tax=Desulfosporosinus sp. Sb-LF TaxID=2560027 RepID=UPI0013051A39|nr:flagellar assembly protein FliW [Desulfosporosinus sp. Sb-LF]
MPNEPRIFHFPQGIPGFETHHDFRFFPEEDAMLAQLISVQEEKIGFILMRPEAYFPEYLKGLDVDEESIKVLNVHADMPVDVWVILTLHRQDMAKTTANLRAPILFNTVDRIGMQVIFNDDRYPSRQPIFTEENQKPRQEGVAG